MPPGTCPPGNKHRREVTLFATAQKLRNNLCEMLLASELAVGPRVLREQYGIVRQIHQTALARGKEFLMFLQLGVRSR